jgi:hypothetical protein
VEIEMVVLLLITIVGSVLVTWLLPKAFNSEPPYGTAVDILVGTAVGVIWAVITYQYIAPLIGLEGPLRLILLRGRDALGIAKDQRLNQAIYPKANRYSIHRSFGPRNFHREDLCHQKQT